MKSKSFIIVSIMLLAAYSKAQTFSFDHDSVSRTYIVHLPPSYSDSNFYPLVINMHGYTSNATDQQFYSEMDPVADTANFIVVYPNGVGNPTSWNSGQTWSYNPGIDDVSFISALIDTMSANYSIDSSMVYACGMSNGGYMSFRLACELEDKIAAIASVTGVMSDSVYTSCQTDRPVPILHMHGTADPTVAYLGTPGNTAVETGIDWWAQNNNCPTSPTITNIPDINMGDGSTVDKYYYGPCDCETEVILYKINGGEHTWPGVSLIIGITNQDIDGSEEIWNFFKKHKLPCPPLVGVSNQKSKEKIVIYPNPFTEQFVIKNLPAGVSNITVYNLLGQVIDEIIIPDNSEGEFRIITSGFPKGSYLLRLITREEIYTYHLIKQ